MAESLMNRTSKSKNTSYIFQILGRVWFAAYNRRGEPYLKIVLCFLAHYSGKGGILKAMPEEHDLSAPIRTNVHTVEECDRMLGLPLTPSVVDAWLDERSMARMAEEAWGKAKELLK